MRVGIKALLVESREEAFGFLVEEIVPAYDSDHWIDIKARADERGVTRTLSISVENARELLVGLTQFMAERDSNEE